MNLNKFAGHCYAVACALHEERGYEVRAVMLLDLDTSRKNISITELYSLIPGEEYPEFQTARNNISQQDPDTLDLWAPIHAYCVDSDGVAIDYEGRRSESDLLDQYSEGKRLFVARFFDAFERIAHLAETEEIKRVKEHLKTT